jgi:hypothetical protein
LADATRGVHGQPFACVVPEDGATERRISRQAPGGRIGFRGERDYVLLYPIGITKSDA